MDDLVYDTFKVDKSRRKLHKEKKNGNGRKNGNKHKKQNPLIKFLRFCLNITILSAVLAFVLISLMFIFYSSNLPSIKELSNITPEDSNVKVLDADNKILADFGAIHSTETTYSDLPVNLINAVIATEDRKFFKHRGIDLIGMIRAGYVNIFAGKIKQGGSTITQQLAKMLFLTPEKTFQRKMKEMILAMRLEKVFSKQEILALYLNKAYFGSGQFGITNASKFYFNKKVEHLNLKESAMIAGLLKAPSKYSPKSNPEAAELRAKQVMINMVDAELLTISDSLISFDESVTEDVAYNSNIHSQKIYFKDWVKSQIKGFIGQKEGKVFVTTTLDTKVQNIVDKNVFKFIQKNESKLQDIELAIIVMGNDGRVLSMVGGKDYSRSQFNRAINAYRQPGSSFKLFVYLAALEKGLKMNDKFNDEPIAVGNWYPDNYGNKYYGTVTMKEAFAKSLNSVAIQVSENVGIQNIVRLAQKMGLTSNFDISDPTVALGSPQVNLLEMTTAYTIVTNGGNAIIPYAIDYVKRENDEIIYNRKTSGIGRVVSADTIEDIKSMMREVMENGTGKAALVKNVYEIGGKTGTSQDYRDAWFLGFVENYTIGIWMGKDDDTTMENVSGGTLPAKLWHDIAKDLAE
jgi:penicillin-binding protein 1A